MKPISPVIPNVDTDKEVVYAKDQPEYLPLPTHRTPDGVVLSRWRLSEDEVQKVVESQSIYLMVHTFNQAMMPVLLSAEPPATFDYLVHGGQQETAPEDRGERIN